MDKTLDESRDKDPTKQRLGIPGDPLGVKQHHWNTGIKENH